MVFYFTATGNSLYVAKCIDEYPVSIPQAIKNSSIYSDKQIGIVCPVYCGEIPNTVKEFLKKSKFDTKNIYICSGADPAALRRRGGTGSLCSVRAVDGLRPADIPAG